MNLTLAPAALVVGLVSATATLAGGALALRFCSALGPLFAFSSGAVIGVALLDLLPEALALSQPHSAFAILSAATAGFLGYFLIDRASALMFGGIGGHSGHLGPGALTVHSLMDGFGIGFAFEVSSAAGLLVAFAVLAHDLIDGANTVALSFAGGVGVPATRRWLIADALAPVVGIGLTRLMVVPNHVLAMLLAVFAGGFLYIGASELLPRSRDRNDSLVTTGATGAGLAFIYAVVRLSNL